MSGALFSHRHHYCRRPERQQLGRSFPARLNKTRHVLNLRRGALHIANNHVRPDVRMHVATFQSKKPVLLTADPSTLSRVDVPAAWLRPTARVEWWSWIRLFIPLAFFTCFGSIYSGRLAERRMPVACMSHSVSFASCSRSVPDIGHSLTELVRYRFQKILSMQMFGKVCAVFVAATPIVLIGGVSYKIVTGCNLGDALFKVYSVMSKLPGASAVTAENGFGLFLCSAVFFAGTFTVAVTLGFVCDDISSLVATVRNGNYQIVESGHMVILNVNERLRPVLNQIAEASKERGSFRCPIVILDQRNKNELDLIVSRAAEGLGLNILTRKGCTHDVMELRRVAAGRAKCIIWLEPNDHEVSVAARRAAAIASIKTLGTGGQHPARMIVQTSQDSEKSKKELTNVPLASRSPPLDDTNKLNIVEVYEEENLDRFLAQCALQPHLSGIMSDIFQHNEGKEFYITTGVSFGGKPYSFARRHFYKAVVCGIYHGAPSTGGVARGRVTLNPPEDTLLQKDDELIVLCSDLWHVTPSAEPLPPAAKWTESIQRHPAFYGSEHVVVLCFGEQGRADSGLLEALGRFAAKDTVVTVVSNTSIENKEHHVGKCQVFYIEGDPTSFKTLKKLRKQKIDSVVLAGLEDLPPEIADAQFISSLIQIQEAANVHWDDKTGFNVVSPVYSADTRIVTENIVAQGKKKLGVPISLDVVLPHDFSSGVLIQVAGFPHLDLVFKDLLSASGSELYIRNVDEFGLAEKGPIKFYEVSDIVRRYGETFLGVLLEDQTFIIAPEALNEREFSPQEKIVVLAEGRFPELQPEPAVNSENPTS